MLDLTTIKALTFTLAARYSTSTARSALKWLDWRRTVASRWTPHSSLATGAGVCSSCWAKCGPEITHE